MSISIFLSLGFIWLEGQRNDAVEVKSETKAKPIF